MKNKKLLNWAIVIILIVLVVVLVSVFLTGNANSKQVSYDTFMKNLESGKIAGVYFESGSKMYLHYIDSEIRPDQFPAKYDSWVQIHSSTQVTERIEELVTRADNPIARPVMRYGDPNKNNIWSSVLIMLVGSVVLVGAFFLLARMSNGANKQAMNFGKTKARLNDNIKVRFTDVAGAEEEKEELAEIVDFLKNPQRFKDAGAKIPKGVLLVGPPGTGKTLFAKAVAGEANVPFFSISGSDFVEMFVGIGASRVRDLFDQAKHNMPCIIFIDEIDAVGRQRGAGLGGGHDEREQTLNQLLVQMDGFEANDGIIIMAATNRADILDPALLRPGRFDRQIYVNAPDVKGREAIFKVHARNKVLAPDVNFKILARLTSGFTGADIANLLNEAAILAARAGRKIIIMEDIYEGINKVIAGPQKKSRVVTETDKRITAYHESGHAIVAKLLAGCDEVQEVSIIPRGMAAGYTLTRPDTDDSFMTKNKLNDMICMMLGGRAAEEIVIKDISTGASNDIERASHIARSMVTEWGMSDELGNIFLGGGHEVFLGRDYGAQHAYSEEIAWRVDKEIKELIDNNYRRALEILRSNREVMDKMVKVLFEKDTIYTDEVEMLFDGKSVEEVIKSIDAREERANRHKEEALKKPIDAIITEEKPKAKQADESEKEIPQNAAEPPKEEKEKGAETDTSQDDPKK